VPEPELRALVVDYGGVLTTDLVTSMGAYCEADGVDLADFGRAMRELLGPQAAADAEVNPVHALERGEMAVPDFERALAARLPTRSGAPVQAEGLLERMFAGFREEPAMVEVVRRARSAGIATALLSNSWGMDYPDEEWPSLFDATVISGEVGLRKPDPEIYLLTAQRLGLPPGACVMVDDLPPNVRGAASTGMVGVHHVGVASTVAELEALFGPRHSDTFVLRTG
jgi:putative hydrolase of the HAD superfamily